MPLITGRSSSFPIGHRHIAQQSRRSSFGLAAWAMSPGFSDEPVRYERRKAKRSGRAPSWMSLRRTV